MKKHGLSGTRYTDSSLPCCDQPARAYLDADGAESHGARTCRECGRTWIYTIRDATAQFIGTDLEGATAFLIAWNRERTPALAFRDAAGETSA